MLEVRADDILPRAAPLHCVADVSDEALAARILTLAPWMPNLRIVERRAQLLAVVADDRPDLVLLGEGAEAEAFDLLGRHIRTERIGVALFHGADAAMARAGTRPMGESPLLAIEAIDPAASVTEIVLRLRSLVRRSRPLALSQRRTIGGITLDEAALTLTIDGASTPVGLDGYRLIGPMFDLPDHVWRAEELHSVAYGALARTSVDTVRVALSRTRRKLAGKLGRDPVRTLRGKGYQLAFLP
ncbi:MAG: helix-turn-helix domain-containing protein [Roseicyclus sp.]